MNRLRYNANIFGGGGNPLGAVISELTKSAKGKGTEGEDAAKGKDAAEGKDPSKAAGVISKLSGNATEGSQELASGAAARTAGATDEANKQGAAQAQSVSPAGGHSKGAGATEDAAMKANLLNN